ISRWCQPIAQERVSRKVLHVTNTSAIPAVAYRRMMAEGRSSSAPEADLDELTRHVLAHPRLNWQTSYNLACAWALRFKACKYQDGRDRDKALGLLESTVNRPFCNQLTQQWVRKDRDLASLKTVPPVAYVFGPAVHERDPATDARDVRR